MKTGLELAWSISFVFLIKIAKPVTLPKNQSNPIKNSKKTVTLPKKTKKTISQDSWGIFSMIDQRKRTEYQDFQ